MSRLLRWEWWSVVWVLLCGPAAGWCVARGYWPAAAVNLIAVLIHVRLIIHYLIIHYRKENHRGSDRQAEASSHDPAPLNFSLSLDPSSATNYLSSIYGAIGSSSGVAVTGGVTRRADPTPELEQVESDMPILAHRVAYLCLDGKREFWSALNGGHGRFGVDADADCRSGAYAFVISSWTGERSHIHTAPAVGCQCGFYALPPDIDPFDECQNLVTLLVELSGTVIEHEKGYRAGHQRVVECQLPPCPCCGKASEVIDVREGRMVRASCRVHVARKAEDQTLVTIADLADLLPVPVTTAGRST